MVKKLNIEPTLLIIIYRMEANIISQSRQPGVKNINYNYVGSMSNCEVFVNSFLKIFERTSIYLYAVNIANTSLEISGKLIDFEETHLLFYLY